MSDRYHKSGSTDWSNAASWRSITFGASAVPLDTEAVYFEDGSDVMTAGMVLGGAGDDLALIDESPGFSGSVGLGGTPLTLKSTNGNALVFNKGGPGRWGVAGQVPTLNMYNGYLAMLGAGEILDAKIYGGELYIGDSCDLNANTLFISDAASVTIEFRGSDSPVITQNGGTCIMRRLHGAYVLNDGRLTYQVTQDVTASTSVTQNGGHFDWQAGNLATWTPKGGTATFENLSRNVAITNAVVFAGTKVTARLGANGKTVTYTGGSTALVPPDK